MRWNKKFDDTKYSLIVKSHKPLTPRPNAHTEEELTWIKNYIRRSPNISLCELYGKLRTEKGYSRHACSLFRIIRKIKYNVNTEHHSKYIPKKYDTPTNTNVKVAPKHRYVGQLPDKFYNILLLMKHNVNVLSTIIKNNLLTLLSILLKDLYGRERTQMHILL